MPCACDTCALGLEACWARSPVGWPRIGELVCGELAALARGERPATDYRGLVRARSDPSYVPPEPEPASATPAPQPVPYSLPACPDRGPAIDASDCPACRTYLCRKFIRVVGGPECTRCEKAGFIYSG